MCSLVHITGKGSIDPSVLLAIWSIPLTGRPEVFCKTKSSKNLYFFFFFFKAPRSAVCAQRQGCLPSGLAGRSPQRKTSWRLWTRSSNPTPSSAPPPDTWPTTEEILCVSDLDLPLQRKVKHVIFLFSSKNKVYSRLKSHFIFKSLH